MAKPVVSRAVPASAAAAVGAATGATAPGATAAAAPPALDLASMEERLRDTHAIGMFTKLSLKNKVDELLTQFRAFHQGQIPPTLDQLRQKYELLLLQVVSLLQDGDPMLAAAISASREALWAILTDPRKFAAL